jgi:hypothetical protein
MPGGSPPPAIYRQPSASALMLLRRLPVSGANGAPGRSRNVRSSRAGTEGTVSGDVCGDPSAAPGLRPAHDPPRLAHLRDQSARPVWVRTYSSVSGLRAYCHTVVSWSTRRGGPQRNPAAARRRAAPTSAGSQHQLLIASSGSTRRPHNGRRRGLSPNGPATSNRSESGARSAFPRRRRRPFVAEEPLEPEEPRSAAGWPAPRW